MKIITLKFSFVNNQTSFMFVPFSKLSQNSIIFNNFKFTIEGNSPYKSDLQCENNKCGCRTNTFAWYSSTDSLAYYEVPKSASSSIRSILKLQHSQTDRLRLLILKCFKNKTTDVTIILSNSLQHLYLRKLINSVLTSMSIGFNSQFGFSNYQLNQIHAKKNNWTPLTSLDCNFKNNITIIRSPYDRTISNWLMFTQQEHRKEWFSHAFGKPAETVTIDEFINRMDEVHNHHWEPQINFLPQNLIKDKSLITIRIKELVERWPDLVQKYGFPKNLVQKNKTLKGHVKIQLNRYQKNIIETKFSEDLDIFESKY